MPMSMSGGMQMPMSGGMPMQMPMSGGMPMPMPMPGGMHMPNGISSMNYSSMNMGTPSGNPTSPNKSSEKTDQANPAATSTPMSPQGANVSVDSQFSYQQAFLQNAAAQNMQIQQQLIMRNQALSQLLHQTSTASNQSNMRSPENDNYQPQQSTPNTTNNKQKQQTTP